MARWPDALRSHILLYVLAATIRGASGHPCQPPFRAQGTRDVSTFDQLDAYLTTTDLAGVAMAQLIFIICGVPLGSCGLP